MNRLRWRKLRLGATAVVVALVFPQDCWTVSPGASSLDVKTTEGALTHAKSSNLVRNGRKGIGTAHEFFSFAYGVPINWEWSYVDATKQPLPGADLIPEVLPGDSLRSALDAMSRKSNPKLILEEISGNLCIRAPFDASEPVVSALDSKVTFTVLNASTWDAMIALARAINESGDTAPMTLIHPMFDVHSRKAPPGFRDASDISLEFDDVTAREALCTIIEASPFEMSYRYWNYYRPLRFPNSKPEARIYISLYFDGGFYRLEERQTAEDITLYAEDYAKMKADQDL